MNKQNAWGLVFAGIAALSGIIVILRGKDSGQNVYNFAPLQSPESTPTNVGYQEPLPLPQSNTSPVIIIDGAGQSKVPDNSVVNAATQQPSNATPIPWPVYQV